MPFDKPTRSSAAKKTTAVKKAKGPTKIMVFGHLSHDPPSTKTETTTVSKQLAQAYDTQFQGLALHARGILSNENEYRVLCEPFEYFQSSAPSSMPSGHYTSLRPHSSIWPDLSPSHASFILNQY